MFLRLPFAAFSALGVAILVALAALFSSSLASPGTAHADHSSPPTVKIKAVMPEVGEEGSYVTVTLQLSRPLTDDEKYCYTGSVSDGAKNEVCIEGGITAWDTYDDHFYEEGGSKYDNGHVPSNEQIKFVFRNAETEKRLSVPVKNDDCITPGRKIRIAINTAFDDVDDYGYDINEKEFTVPVNGNDTTNGTLVDDGGTCASVDTGVTEEADYNKAPSFDANESPVDLSVDENTGAGQDVGSPVSASDPENDTLTYSLQGTDAASFDIDSSSGQIKTKASLDHETKDTYHVAVFVRDSKNIHGNSDTVDDNSIDVKINVRDVNEPPVIDAGASTALSVQENTAAGENVGSAITATDPDDGDTIAYSLDDADGASFAIESDGQIKTKEPLDKETKDTYTVIVTVTDSDNLEDTHTVTITVTDDTTEQPTFDEEYADGETSITRQVAENAEAGQPVGDPVSATDDDGDTLTYSLDTTGAESFDIDTATGQIKTKAGVDLDYETTPSYLVTVSITDSEDGAGNTEDPPVEDATIDVTINVTNVNEGPAFADDAPATQEVAENTAAGTNIGNAYTATDPEGDTPTYSLAGTDAASFDIDDTTGQLNTKADLDHETKASYSVTIQVTDGLNGEGTTEGTATIDDTHDVTVTVTNVDDEGELTLSSENPVVNSALTATLTDQDGGITGETWKWEISEDGQSNWNTISGKTTNSYTPDSDDVGKYLRASVGYTDGEGSGKSAETEASNAVVLRPATNENPEFADATTTREIAENTAANTNIGAPVSATHADSKGTLKYLLGGTDATSFAIDTTTGQLKTNADLDHETKDEYTVTVSVSDELDNYEAADTVNDDSIEVTITVSDVNEPPAFDSGNDTEITVAENTATDTLIGNAFSATDPEGDDIDYRIGEGFSDYASFRFDETTRRLKTKDPLDYETKSSYKVVMEVRDNKASDGTPDTNSDQVFHEVTITVTDVDEDGSLSLSSDHPRVGAPLTATLKDEDTGHTNIEWVWEKSDDGNTPWSAITGATSATYTPVADDMGDHLRVNIEYDDKHGADKTLMAQARNAVVANTTPEFSGTTTTRSVPENTPSGRNIGAPVTATDSDTGIGDELTYSLSGTNASSFSIVSSSGQLQTSAALDFETKASYTVVVTATDTANATDTITVTINVTDVSEGGSNNGNVGGNNPGNNNPSNNNPGTNTKSPNSGGGFTNSFTPKTPANRAPNFSGGTRTSRSVAEKTEAGVNIGAPVSATDADGNTLTYTLGGANGSAFDIDSSTGQLKTKAELDFEI